MLLKNDATDKKIHHWPLTYHKTDIITKLQHAICVQMSFHHGLARTDKKHGNLMHFLKGILKKV